jgi:hypothetical protein
MEKITAKLLLLLMLGLPAISFAQDCVDYHKRNCKSQERKNADGTVNTNWYVISDESRSALMMKGQKSEFRFTIHQGKDFRLSLCAADVLGEKIQFQLVDFEENTVLYDNAQHGYSREFEFTVMRTRNLKIVIILPTDGQATNQTSIGFKAKNTEVGCVGVLIESMVTPKTGF